MNIIALDPGTTESGWVHHIPEKKKINGFVCPNVNLKELAKTASMWGPVMLLIEDLQPYNMKATPDLIGTAKWIGRVQEAFHEIALIEMINRIEVRKACFDNFPEICIPLIQAKQFRKAAKTGIPTKRKPSVSHVNDACVVACMRKAYDLPLREKKYGIESHAFQALALIWTYLHRSK